MVKCRKCGSEFEGNCCPNCGTWATGEKIALNLGLELVKYEGGDADVTVPDKITRIGDEAFVNNYNLTNIVIPDSVKSIGENAFTYCVGLTAVTLPSSVNKIGKGAFSYCSGLRSITIPNSVAHIGNSAFAGCGDLIIYCEAAIKPNGWDEGWNNSNCPVVWDYKNDGKDEGGYEYAVIDNIKYSLKNGKAAAVGQSNNISNAEIPARVNHKNTTFSVTAIGNYAFCNCKELKSVIIPDSVKSIGGSAFAGCSGLKNVTLPDGVTSIGGFAFGDCDKLTGITIRDGMISIGSSAFAGCSRLMGVTVGKGLTSIGYAAFNGCGKLTKIILPDSVTSICGFAFNGCKGLANIAFNGRTEQWNAIKKSGGWNKNTGNFTITCLDGTLDKDGKEID